MPELWSQIVLGIVQGVTEWLPISSSGHLALAEYVLKMRQDLAYDVFLHIGSVLVMLLYFRKDLARLVRSGLIQGNTAERSLLVHIIAATGVTVLIALVLEPYEPALRAPQWLALGLLVNAVVLFMSSWHRGNRAIDLQHALLLGAVQGVAVVPSLSRSGLTIAVALLLGIRSAEAFRFSFLIALPAISAAIIYKLDDMTVRPEYVAGFIVTILAGYASLWLLERIIRKDALHLFWIYNVLLAIGILLVTTYASGI